MTVTKLKNSAVMIKVVRMMVIIMTTKIKMMLSLFMLKIVLPVR